MPALSYAGPAARAQTPSPASDDPVWAQIQDDLKHIDEEIRNKKPTPQTLRAFESTLRFHAAHISSKGLDQRVAQLVKRQMRAKGRAAFLADAAETHRLHERDAERRAGAQNQAFLPHVAPTAEELGQVADRLARGNFAAMIREAADASRSLRERVAVDAPQGVRLVAYGGRVDGYCSDFGQIIAGLRWLKDFVCMLAIFDPPLFLAECAALQMELWTMEMFEWFFCTEI
ncbi:MAG: hypothetical protein ABI665_04550 [Vicinamibacterales bacterium]